MHAPARALAAWLPGHHLALPHLALPHLALPHLALPHLTLHHLTLGGGGLAHWIVRLFIWHEIWRLIRYLWRIPTFGPFIVVALALIIVGLAVWRQYRRTAWAGNRRGRRSAGYGTGGGPRDW